MNPTTARPTPTRLALRAVAALTTALALLVGGLLTVAPAAHAADTASISGTVTGPSGPMADVDVYLYEYDAEDDWWYITDNSPVTTNGSGAYSATGLPAGTYRASFYDPEYTEVYWPAASTVEEAEDIVVGEGAAVTNINGTLTTANAMVSGTVRTPTGGAAADTVAILFQVDGSDREPVNGTLTSSTGSYSLAAPSAGTYTLGFFADDYPEQYLGDKSSVDTAATFTLSDAQVRTGVNYTLRRDGTLDPAPSTTSLTLAHSTRAYGQSTTANVSVASAVSRAGSVTIKDGAKVLATRTLVNGAVQVALPKTLSVAKHNITATFTPSGAAYPSTSAVRTLTVTKAKSTTKATLAKSTIKKSKKGKVTVTVTAIGVTPSGKVKIKDGTKVLKTATLSGGKVTVTLPKLKKGKHKISASYAGSSTVTSGKSKTVTLTVKK